MEIKTLKLKDINPAPYNPRKDLQPDDPEYVKLKKAIDEFGLVDPLVVNKRGNVLISGHQRHKILLARGDTETQVSIVDLPPQKEKALNLALNKISGEWDNIKLKDILEELDTGDFDIEITGFDLQEIEDLMTQVWQDEEGTPEVYEDDVPEPPEEPVCKTGDLWILGKHRLLCGDSTKSENIVRLMGDLKADMVLTDPPYGVDYTGKTKNALKIQNDTSDEEALEELVKGAFDAAQEVSRPGAYWYATVPAGPLHLIFASDWKRRGTLRQILVWVKDSMVLGHSEYHYKHEPILFGWVPGDRHKNPDRTRTSVWEVPRPKRSEEHPTMKPVALWAQAIEDGSKPGELVYDPFLGSGTTIVAAEQLDRVCFGVEIDPKYCDVIIQRWENLTGEKAKKG